MDQCRSCRSAFFHFGGARELSHRSQYNADQEYQQYLVDADDESMSTRYQATLDRIAKLFHTTELRIFDIGAGAGHFLSEARRRGMTSAGNEVSRPAIEECRKLYNIELFEGDDLRSIASDLPAQDAVTMWCVIAHVDDPDGLLLAAKSLLKPGGILFFTTPRYCAIDRLALALTRLGGARYRRVFDRRINQYHRRQYTERGIESLLIRHGFSDVEVRAAVGYGLHMHAYLRSVGVRGRISALMSKPLTSLSNRGLLPRNVLNVYAQV